MKCTKCGAEFDGNYCPKCGTPCNPNKNICPKCGKERGANDRFCKNCGYSFMPAEQKNKASSASNSIAAAIKAVRRTGIRSYLEAATMTF